MIPLVYKQVKPGLYFIEENGQIYSKAKKGYITPSYDKDGYLQVLLQKNEGGRNNRVCYRVATLVIYSFIGPPPENLKDPTINHIDGDKTNNNYTNLEWIERSVNSKIRFITAKEEHNGAAKLSCSEVHQICQLLADTDLTVQEIGDKLNVSKSTISNILSGKNWVSISDQYDFSFRKTIRDENGKYKVINLKGVSNAN